MFRQSSSSDRLSFRKKTTRVVLTIFALSGLIASTVPADGLPDSVYTLKEAMENGVDIELTSEGCYAGECVGVYAFNRNDETVNLKISMGDVLLNKNEDEQNLVVTADLTMVIPARQAVEHRLSTLCLDAARGGPSEGQVFDVAANLREWPAETPASMLLAALEGGAGRGLERSDWLQEVTWKLTDDRQIANTAAQELLRSIGIDPEGTAPSFPHLRNPNQSSLDTGYVARPVASDGLRSGSDLQRVTHTPAQREPIMATAERRASPLAEGVGGNGAYSGNFYRMVVAYHGFDAARAVLDEICGGYAPGLIFTVYRPGDLDRDRWCLARYQEVDEILAIAAD